MFDGIITRVHSNGGRVGNARQVWQQRAAEAALDATDALQDELSAALRELDETRLQLRRIQRVSRASRLSKSMRSGDLAEEGGKELRQRRVSMRRAPPNPTPTFALALPAQGIMCAAFASAYPSICSSSTSFLFHPSSPLN
jgi:hypothetical protein